MVRLSASVLNSPQVPPFSGSIEVDITAEDLPQQNAEFGKCHPLVCIDYDNVCLVGCCQLCTVIYPL